MFGCSSQKVDSSEISDRPEPPAEYTESSNPYNNDTSAVQDGKKLYQSYCISCHGDAGRGDGPAAPSMDPRPQDLTETVPVLSDAYLFWRITEGGQMEPFNSGMLAWKGILTEEEIWKVVAYLRTIGQ
jgi:mono/diheme cytochrome c family protein